MCNCCAYLNLLLEAEGKCAIDNVIRLIWIWRHNIFSVNYCQIAWISKSLNISFTEKLPRVVIPRANLQLTHLKFKLTFFDRSKAGYCFRLVAVCCPVEPLLLRILSFFLARSPKHSKWCKTIYFHALNYHFQSSRSDICYNSSRSINSSNKSCELSVRRSLAPCVERNTSGQRVFIFSRSLRIICLLITFLKLWTFKVNNFTCRFCKKFLNKLMLPERSNKDFVRNKFAFGLARAKKPHHGAQRKVFKHNHDFRLNC